MKRRFITKYRLTDPKDVSGATVWGTCPRWLKEIQAYGYVLISKETVLWYGTPPRCGACMFNTHWGI